MRYTILYLVLCIPSLVLAQALPEHSPTAEIDPIQVLSTVEDAGTLLRADKDAYANTFVSSSMTPDGGSAKYSFISNRDSCWKTGAGDQSEFCSDGNSLNFYQSEVKFSTARTSQPACTAGTSCGWYSDVWAPGVIPRGSLPVSCAAGQAGFVVALSTDGNRHYYCDGTTAQRFGVVWGNTASVNFSSMAAGASDLQTMTLAGALTTDTVHCSPLSSPEDDLDVRYFQVTATNTVTLAVRNNSGGTLDPAAISWKCAVIR